MNETRVALGTDGSALPRILCVDDEPLILAGLSDSLRRHFDVTGVTSGRDGLRALIESGPYTLVVSDFAMPGMNGAEFLALARIAAPDTVRILLTGQASLESALVAVNEGNIFRFLTKPCPPSTLIRALEDAVEQARLETADLALVQRRLDTMSRHLLRTERLASLGTMASAVGHQLNHLLTGFANAMQAVQRDVREGRLPSEANLGALLQIQEHLAVHAQNLLEFGRPPRRDQPGGGTADVGVAVREALRMLGLAGMLGRAQILLDLPQEPIIVAISAAEVEQMLVNLVKNAVDALADAHQPNALIQIKVGYGAAPGFAICVVSDNGVGIHRGTLPLLFEPYYTTKSRDHGAGLGLFVVRQIVRNARGDVSVQSEEGRGTTLTLTLPVDRTSGNGCSTGA